METKAWRALALTAVAPAAWGTTYLVTEMFLPPDRPLFAALVRALPAGLLLLAVRRSLPHGEWWWKSAVLGALNFGLFFPLIFLSAYRLPGGLAATVQATLPLAVMALAWPIIHERPVVVRVVAALVGLSGVGLLVLRSPESVDPIGLTAAIASVLVAGLGSVLVKKWRFSRGLSSVAVPMLDLVTWQLVAGGLLLLPLALVVEGAPPRLDTAAVAGFLWIGGVGTVVAYACWFHGLSVLPAGSVALVGLLNPVVATALGIVFAGELFGWPQALGMALVVAGVLGGQLRLAPPGSRRPRHVDVSRSAP